MPFVTTLTLQSGDRTALESVVTEIRESATRKGVELKGPQTPPPITCRAPLFWDLQGEQSAGTWEFSVYERTMQIVGHQEIARRFAGWDLPDSVRAEVEVDQVRSVGSR